VVIFAEFGGGKGENPFDQDNDDLITWTLFFGFNIIAVVLAAAVKDKG